jgi:glycosyltransferase involved in cell wall biosynthesis
LVGAEYGSAASMGFEVLKELLRRRHEVDFFSKRTYVYPEPLIGRPGFAYKDCDQPHLDSLIGRLGTTRLHRLAMSAGNATYMRRVIRTMVRLHEDRPYDAELFLGQWAYGRVPRLPVLSWVQGAPGSDARSVKRHGPAIRRLCGWEEYAKLLAYSRYRESYFGRAPVEHTDASICGSCVSREILVNKFGLPPGSVHALPYPLDLERFRPAHAPDMSATPELLWVGRIVPRKRLDLFLDAGAHLLRSGVSVTLTVVGGFPFAQGYRELVAGFPFPDRLTYLPHLSRDDVRGRMQRAAVLVAPSEEEDFGSSVAEALACGTPVVVGPSNGTREYIGAGGECFSAYSAASVAGAIERIVSATPERRATKRVQAREAAVRYFSVGLVVDRLEDLLRSTRPAGGGHS